MLATALAVLLASAPKPELEAKARALLDRLLKGDFNSAVTAFSPQMKSALPASTLETSWQSLVLEPLGRCEQVVQVRFESRDGMDAVTLATACERGAVDLRVAFDKTQAIVGLWFKPPDPPVDVDALAIGKALVARLAAADFEGAVKGFDGTMSAGLPKEKLAAVWKGLGELVKVGGARRDSSGHYQVALVACVFKQGTLTAKVVIDPQGKVAGLFFLPGDLTLPWSPPPYGPADRLRERELVVGTLKLPGRLTLPKNGKGPFPAVVLVHGSGPSDEDETISFSNKVFRDLAYGLTAQGIAVLRYVKRTAASKGGADTVRDEVLDDAAAALDALAAQPEVDKKRLFVLGHSLGGYLMPWLARDRPELGGVVLLAAPARPMLELLVEQSQYFVSLAPDDASAKALLESARRFKARSEAKDLRPEETVFHAPGSYWLALRDYRPVEVAAKLKTPMLVLQGERDYQVSFKSDFGAFKRGLEGRPQVTFKSYPALNHLFFAGQGPSTPAEYERPAHVDAAVIKDVAGWVLLTSRAR